MIGRSLIDSCGFDRIPDYFRDWTTDGGSVMLCDHEASTWWDTDGATEIYITFSNKPHAGAYKVMWICDFCIKAENGEGVHRYDIYRALYRELNNFNHTCYMGIEIIK